MGSMTAVVAQLEQELHRAQREVQQFSAALAALGTKANGSRTHRTVSAEARRKMSLAQKARWAKSGTTPTATVASTHSAKPSRVMSAASRRKIAAAQRARWAKVRAAKA